MQKLRLIKISIVVVLFFLSACVIDWHTRIATFKNNTSSRLLIAKLNDERMTDSILYNERFSKYWVEAKSSGSVSLPNMKLSYQSDSVKAYLYVFNSDSLFKYQDLKKVEGIVQHSFIRKVVIQLNKVKESLDTIYIK